VKSPGVPRLRRRALGVLAATLFATAVARGDTPATPSAAPPASPSVTAPGAASATAPPARRLGPPDLRDQFQRADKSLRKAANALEGHDAGRVSLLLQRADEEIVTFEQGSGLGDFVRETGAARLAASAGEMTAADRAVRRARAASASLADYTVARPAEVAYRSALAAIGDGSAADLLAALDGMEAAVRAPLLLDRVHAARAAITRARAAMVRNDFPGGRNEVTAAHAALDAVSYVGALSRSCYAFLAAGELLHDRAILTARDQLQRGLHDLATAQELAPQPDLEDLNAAHDEAIAIYKRMNHPIEGDPGALAAASARHETVRQRQR
jgi:hypothetical protein